MGTHCMMGYSWYSFGCMLSSVGWWVGWVSGMSTTWRVQVVWLDMSHMVWVFPSLNLRLGNVTWIYVQVAYYEP